MSLFCLHRLYRPCQFWTRWRMCIIFVVLSQSVLLLFFSDLIQKKSPRTTVLDHTSLELDFTRTIQFENSSIQDEGMQSQGQTEYKIRSVNISGAGDGGVSIMQRSSNFNKSDLLQFNVPQRRAHLKYEIPEVKLKKINVAKLKQTIDSLSLKAEQSIKELTEKAWNVTFGMTGGNREKNERPLKNVISREQSENDKAITNKNDKSKGRKGAIKGGKQKGARRNDGGGENYRDATKDDVDKVKADQYNIGLTTDRRSKSKAVNIQHDGKTSKLRSLNDPRIGVEVADTRLRKKGEESDVIKVSISSGKRLAGTLIGKSADRTQQGVMKHGVGFSGSRGVEVINVDSRNRSHKKSQKAQINPGPHPGASGISDSTSKLQVNLHDLESHPKVKVSHKSRQQGYESVLLTGAKTKYSIHRQQLHTAANISQSASQNSSDLLANMTLTEALSFELPPRISVPNFFHFKDEESVDRHFKSIGDNRCFIDGTEESVSHRNKSKHCNCKLGFYGQHCSIPDFVYFSVGSRYLQKITPRNKTRRIINALTYNMETELLEARLNDLWDVVDVFLILESNYSYHGDAKPLHLWESMRRGFLKKFHSKILYIFLDHFPDKGRKDGWLADRYPRQYIGQTGLRHVLGTRPDDLLVYTDTDEIPSRESLLFLRLHDGYPEPFGFTLRWSVYGFFWQQLEPTRVWAGCTLAMLRLVFNWDIYSMRSGNYWNTHQASVATYLRAGGDVNDWYLGGVAGADGSLSYTGWHCSWCLPPARIRTKLTSAINADFPRWGDFPEKLDLNYIRSLVRSGLWFDDTTKIGDLTNPDDDNFFAPSYFLDNSEKYRGLLDLNEALKL